jgi:hypothetical protein
MSYHRDLCLKGAAFMKKNGLLKWQRPVYVVCELERANAECPDVFGFGSALTQLVEVKVTRSDFLNDRNKIWRINPQEGIGQLRSYLCPEGLVGIEDLPDKWGLLYAVGSKKIITAKEPEVQISDTQQEMNLAASILRREGIPSKIFSYKKYCEPLEASDNL